MRAIDTNLLVRLLTQDDTDQAKRAERYIETGAWVSHLVLVETVWVLESVYELDTERIALAVGMLLEHAQLVLQDPDVIRAALARLGTDGSVGFSDCMILESARKAGHVPLGTFDRALLVLDGAELL